ncbi:MAG: InlB B-repeat-containing protein [Kiritimatiellae bacterium]|nr:InlB B-repeat-containing protein [Kiritimatiellia bacterium]
MAGKTYYYWVVAVKSSGNITSSSNTGYRASSSGGSSGSGSGSGSGSSDNGQPYTVKFNANGGTGSMANESFVYGTPKALTINTFTRTGYIFVGWAKSASATTPAYDDGESVSDLTTTSGGTVNLYAVWQANNYTIKFNKNGGTGSMANLAMTYGTAKALTANAFQRVNYKFIGWSTTASATSATYTDKQSVSNLTSTPDGTVNLYAVWKLILEVTSVTARQRYPWNGLVDIDVTFAASGLSTVSFTVKDTKGNTNLNARTFYVGNPEQNNRTLEVQPGTRRFVWDAFADLGQVTLTSFAVTAKVTEKNFQVNVTGGTGSGSFIQGKSVTISAASKTGYTFASWSGTTADTGILASATSASTTLTIPSRDVAYEATYTPNTYTVKFNANGGSGTMAYESFTYDVSKALTANAFTRNGWNFLGWAESADATTAKYTNGQSVKNLATAGTKNLYAVWERSRVQLWANGPYWAACNIGAEKPEDYGYYFWWGCTVGYMREGNVWMASNGSSSNYSFSQDHTPTFDKNISYLKIYGWITDDDVLVPSRDAANVHWGGGWRMPTDQELRDLNNNCDWTWTTLNGINGYVVKGKGAYVSANIFLPCAGRGSGESLNYAGTQSYYWSSVPYSSGGKSAWGIDFDSSDHAVGPYNRGAGLTIRPVRDVNQ